MDDVAAHSIRDVREERVTAMNSVRGSAVVHHSLLSTKARLEGMEGDQALLERRLQVCMGMGKTERKGRKGRKGRTWESVGDRAEGAEGGRDRERRERVGGERVEAKRRNEGETG